MPIVRDAASYTGIDSDHIFLFNDTEVEVDSAHTSIQQLMSYGPSKWTTFDDMKRSTSTIANLNTTSGTTGLPKMAARSHHSLVTEHQAIEEVNTKLYDVSVIFTHITTRD